MGTLKDLKYWNDLKDLKALEDPLKPKGEQRIISHSQSS